MYVPNYDAHSETRFDIPDTVGGPTQTDPLCYGLHRGKPADAGRAGKEPRGRRHWAQVRD